MPNPFRHVHFDSGEDAMVIVDGNPMRLRDLPKKTTGRIAFVYRPKKSDLEWLSERLDVDDLRFKAIHIGDLSPLQKLGRLKSLQITWNTKLANLDSVGQLTNLEVLSLQSTNKIRNLDSLAALTTLRVLEIDAGLWNKITLETLEPLRFLPNLEELYLNDVKVISGGLSPIGKCKSLRYLALPHKYGMEDYAQLSAELPSVECRQFWPWVQIQINDKVKYLGVAKGTSLLDPSSDRAKIDILERKFLKLRTQFEAGLNHSG
ncbi:MAG: hypothetical protein GC165_19275 [Armatimonadetes bacterium]|nr:hypothetical protein [Armatimonadota bacterium]MBS1727902.1 hypothetical protein [Armatimonadota bacterium]